MDVTLKPELELLVNERVERGEYESADAFVQQAILRLIEEEDAEDAQVEDIRLRVEAAEAEIDRGEFVEFDAETVPNLAADVHKRGLQGTATNSGNTKPPG